MAQTTGSLDLVIVQGATFTSSLNCKDSSGVIIDFPNHTAKIQIREAVEDATVLLELTSAAGDIVINTPSGNVTITITPSVTEAITWTTGVYDLKITNTLDADDVINLVYGDVSVRQQVTRG
jgi:hypothetical protein